MTSEELFKKYSDHTALSEGHYAYLVNKEDFQSALIEFTKFHLEAALKKASEKVYFRDSDGFILNTSEESKKVILDSYPLENIK